MKRLLLGLLTLAFLGGAVAQTTPATKAQTPSTRHAAKTKTTVNAKTSTENTTEAKTSTETTASNPVKKNGTPDMRYKSNKQAAKSQTTTHVKKDGTPDKRYKENKKS